MIPDTYIPFLPTFSLVISAETALFDDIGHCLAEFVTMTDDDSVYFT